MKTGYSILLGEYVDAEVLEYRDCEPFQIVCPVCSEPLFKVARSRDAGAIEYLSHYRRADAYDANCELRVDASASSDRERHNTQSRNQKLEYFLGVFLELLRGDPAFTYTKGISSSHKHFNKSRAMRSFREHHHALARKNGMADDYSKFKEVAYWYINKLPLFEKNMATGFSTSTQVRIAYDLMKLLLTAEGNRNYFALLNHAAIVIQMLAYRTRTQKNVREQVLINIADYIEKMSTGGTRAGVEVILEMEQRPIPDADGTGPSNYLQELSVQLGQQMIGTLVRLPYFSLLKRRGSAGVPR